MRSINNREIIRAFLSRSIKAFTLIYREELVLLQLILSAFFSVSRFFGKGSRLILRVNCTNRWDGEVGVEIWVAGWQKLVQYEPPASNEAAETRRRTFDWGPSIPLGIIQMFHAKTIDTPPTHHPPHPLNGSRRVFPIYFGFAKCGGCGPNKEAA